MYNSKVKEDESNLVNVFVSRFFEKNPAIFLTEYCLMLAEEILEDFEVRNKTCSYQQKEKEAEDEKC